MTAQITIDTSIQFPDWEESCDDCEALISKGIHAVFKQSPVARNMIESGIEPEISVVLANDDLVHVLNRDYRDKDKPTNILSFAQLDDDDGWHAPDMPGPCVMGDLILAYETIQKESVEHGKPFEDHFLHLVIHGMLHLLGYDHIEEDEAEEMESLEIQILSDFGINNPYKIVE
jgi:probable rRNA maturation factor